MGMVCIIDVGNGETIHPLNKQEVGHRLALVADKQFYWAKAIIKGNDVVVYSDKVSEPVAVRYAWADNPVCNLVNSEGLPAVSFRTDKWKGITQK